MDSFRKFINGPKTTIAMDLADPAWPVRAGIPRKHGLYFISTTAPIDVIAKQELWGHEYPTKKKGSLVPVKNYNLAARCRRRTEELAGYWNTAHVYSGLATNLQARAREHTLPDPGTGALALARYPALKRYSWSFSFLTVEQFMPDCKDPRVLLHLGEQIWRAQNGWPVLCAK